MKAITLTALSLGALVTFSNVAEAGKFWKRAKRANKVENKIEKRAAREEAILDKKDFKEEATHGSDATPLLNKQQRKLEKRIAAGLKSGKLSNGEAASLRRKLNSLARYEASLKSGDLSTRDRERLHKKSLEIKRELNKELRD